MSSIRKPKNQREYSDFREKENQDNFNVDFRDASVNLSNLQIKGCNDLAYIVEDLRRILREANGHKFYTEEENLVDYLGVPKEDSDKNSIKHEDFEPAIGIVSKEDCLVYAPEFAIYRNTEKEQTDGSLVAELKSKKYNKALYVVVTERDYMVAYGKERDYGALIGVVMEYTIMKKDKPKLDCIINIGDNQVKILDTKGNKLPQNKKNLADDFLFACDIMEKKHLYADREFDSTRPYHSRSHLAEEIKEQTC